MEERGKEVIYISFFELHNVISHPAKTGIWLSWPEVQIISTAPCCQVGGLTGGKGGQYHYSGPAVR